MSGPDIHFTNPETPFMSDNDWKPAPVALLKHIHELWPLESKFLATADLIDMLVISHPTVWGSDGPFGKPLTARRLGSMLAKGYKIHSKRESRTGPRGYLQFDFVRAWSRMGVTPPPESGASGATGPSGAEEDDRYYLIDPETGQKVWEDTP